MNQNTLYSVDWWDIIIHCQQYNSSNDNLSSYDLQGEHKIYVDSNLEEGHCGLVPLGEPCSSCTTSGLKWNLGMHVDSYLQEGCVCEYGCLTITFTEG